MTPVKSIHAKCLECMGGSAQMVTSCNTARCLLHAYRTGKISHEKRKTPLKAIRSFCLECVESAKEVRECAGTKCPLYSRRMGHRPADYKKQAVEKAFRRQESRSKAVVV